MSVGTISLAWGLVSFAICLHYTSAEDMCAAPPSIHVDTTASADAHLLLRITSDSGEDCWQYCCVFDGCSVALFSVRNRCDLLACPSGLCVGGPQSATTLYLMSNDAPNELLHNEIRQLGSTTTTASTVPQTTLSPGTGAATTTERSTAATAAATNTASTTKPVTTTSEATETVAEETAPTEGTESAKNVTATDVATAPTDAVGTEAATNVTTTDVATTTALQTTSRITESTQASAEPTASTQTAQTTAASTSSPATQKETTLNVTESMAPSQRTATSVGVTESPNATDTASVTETSSVTPPNGGTTPHTTVTPPPSNPSTTASVNASGGTGAVPGRMVDGQTLSAEKRHWSRDWRRKHFQEHLPAAHSLDSSVVDDILSDIFGDGEGDGKLGGGNGVSRTNSRLWGEKSNTDLAQPRPVPFKSNKGYRKQAHGDPLRAYPLPQIPPSNYPTRHHSKPVLLTSSRYFPYPIPHKIAGPKYPVVQGTATQQATNENQTTVTVLTTARPSNEPSSGATTSSQFNSPTTVISTAPLQTTFTGTTPPSGTETTFTSGNNTTSYKTSSQATNTTSSGTTGTTTTTTVMVSTEDSAESTESTASVSVGSTPLISANGSLADIAIEANDKAMSAALIAALSFGILFFAAVIVLLSKRLYDGWQRRHYSRVDYLVNGMYN